MQTMQSVLLYGRYEWDSERLPRVEFEERLSAARLVMRERGWRALVAHGDARENGLLCYLTNFVPYLRWGLALVGLDGPVRLVAAVGPRDLPSVKRLTPIEDIRASSDVGASISDWLSGQASLAAGSIAIANLGHMRLDVGRKAMAACDGFGGAVEAGAAFAGLLRAGRPRELALVEESHASLRQACGEIEQARAGGRSIKEALVAAERTARLAGAQDVRLLFDAGGSGCLRPIDSTTRANDGQPWSIYLAVRRGGYWSQAMTTFAARPPAVAIATRAALAEALGHVKGGTTVADIARTLKARLAGYQPHPVLKDGVWRACGLSLDREPWHDAGSHVKLGNDGAHVVAAGARDRVGMCAVETATLILRGGKAEISWPVGER